MSDQPAITSRIYKAVCEVDLDTAYIFDERIATAINRLGFKNSKDSAGYGVILKRGLEALEDDWESRSGKAGKWAYYGEETRQTERDREEKFFLARMYEKKGLDGFVEWCKIADIDWETFLSEYDLVREARAINRSDRFRLFLDRILRGKGPVLSEEVRKAAEVAGVVVTEDDWKFMRVVASRDGLTSVASHGYWVKE